MGRLTEGRKYRKAVQGCHYAYIRLPTRHLERRRNGVDSKTVAFGPDIIILRGLSSGGELNCNFLGDWSPIQHEAARRHRRTWGSLGNPAPARAASPVRPL